MRIDDGRWLELVDRFHSAALTQDGWYPALEGLAAATGSRVGELIGLGASRSVPFNLITDLGSDWHEHFAAIGGGDPAVNPFVRAGTRIGPLEVLSSAEFLSPVERRQSFFIQEHANIFDIPHICLTPLMSEPDRVVGLAVIRSASQGEILPEQRRIFATLAPHVRAAVRSQLLLEQQSAAIMAGALEAVSLCVYVCDKRGRVLAMTRHAESLLANGHLFLNHGMLRGSYHRENRELLNALQLVAGGLQRPGEPLHRTLMLRGRCASPLFLDVIPVPAVPSGFTFEPRAMVLVRQPQRDLERMGLLLQAAYGLTNAESDVAQRLWQGLTPDTIAAARGASLGTVRAQIRAIYAKLGVHHLSELIARINQLT